MNEIEIFESVIWNWKSKSSENLIWTKCPDKITNIGNRLEPITTLWQEREVSEASKKVVNIWDINSFYLRRLSTHDFSVSRQGSDVIYVTWDSKLVMMDKRKFAFELKLLKINCTPKSWDFPSVLTLRLPYTFYFLWNLAFRFVLRGANSFNN